MIRVMVFNATFNNISVISWRSVFIGGGNRSTPRKPLTCRKSLTNFIALNASIIFLRLLHICIKMLFVNVSFPHRKILLHNLNMHSFMHAVFKRKFSPWIWWFCVLSVLLLFIYLFRQIWINPLSTCIPSPWTPPFLLCDKPIDLNKPSVHMYFLPTDPPFLLCDKLTYILARDKKSSIFPLCGELRYFVEIRTHSITLSFFSISNVLTSVKISFSATSCCGTLMCSVFGALYGLIVQR